MVERIPDRSAVRSAAATLGVDLAGIEARVQTAIDAESATAELHAETKRRYRELAKRIHPDVAGDHDRMVAANKAKEILLGVRLVLRQAPQITITISNPGCTTTMNGFTDLWASIMNAWR